jgi:hypothetical protein
MILVATNHPYLRVGCQTGVGLVSNSSFLNRDVGITWLVILNFGKQIIVSPLLYLPLYLLVLLCFRSISCDVLHCLVDIVYVGTLKTKYLHIQALS